MKRLLRLCAVVPVFFAFTGLAQSPPDLHIDFNTGSQFRLSWANTPGDIVLEEADTLGPDNVWQPFPQIPVLLDNRFTITIDHGGSSRRFFRLRMTGGAGLPPDPATIAPSVPQGVATQMAGAVEFLYTGSNRIQTGVVPGTIDEKRVAVLRGRAVNRSGEPLPGVQIAIPGHPEFGQTLTRADGMFDLAVNGGGPLTIDYTLAGYLPAQRQVHTPWQDYVWVPEVALIPLDTNVTTIAANSGSMQVHQSAVRTDGDGGRKATLLFPAGTTATMVMPDGSTQPLTDFHVRASEYTVGPHGPMAMPGELPPTSGYTYAVEFSIDEAVSANAATVRFNQTIPTYVENFLSFPVGENVPVGYYDRKAGAWVPSDNGRVIKITAINGGIATVDSVGAGGLPPLVLDSSELQNLATLYGVGQELWRTPVTHFSAWDSNWGVSPPSDADSPPEDPGVNKPVDDCCDSHGNSVIEGENQTLGETVGIVGTPYSLHYQSDRVPGRKGAYDVDIPLSGATLPGPVTGIDVEIQIAGRMIRQNFPPAPNQRLGFTWDGKDAYGRTLQGSHLITVRTGYTYGGVYQRTPRFGYNGNGQLITGSRSRQEVTLWRSWRGTVGTWDSRANGLGGWTMSEHHNYDPISKVLYRGDGGRQSVDTLKSNIITTFAGPGTSDWTAGDGLPATQASVCPFALATGPDGSVYIASSVANRIRRIAPNGITSTFAGGGFGPGIGDGGPANQAMLQNPQAVAVGADGSVYISDSGHARVRKVDTNGIITTFAGNGLNGFAGDGGLATSARIASGMQSIAVGLDNSVYFADRANRRIRRVGPDGIITTVAGDGTSCGPPTGACGDGGPATQASLNDPRGLAMGRDGSLYIGDISFNRIRRVTPSGLIYTVAGTGDGGYGGDGGLATQAQLSYPSSIAVGPDGSIYIADLQNSRVRWLRPDGIINTLGGTGVAGRTGDGGLATRATLSPRGVAIGPDGSIYVAQTTADTDSRVRKIGPIAEKVGAGGTIVPSEDGSEVYLLAPDGRHLQTKDAITGALRYQFTYDSAGRLATLADAGGNVTTIQRDVNGTPTAIVGPFGQSTALMVNPDGFLSQITSPSGEAMLLSYTPDGLLSTLTDPRGNASNYQFDPRGRLTSATDPNGATKTIARTGANNDYTVTLTTALGRASSYRVEHLSNGSLRRTATDPAGRQVQAVIATNGTQTSTFPDGTTVVAVPAPDPRWGMRAPFFSSVVVTTPGGRVLSTTSQRAVTLSNPADVLSLATLSETVTINGRVFSNVYNAANRPLTSTSPEGRKSTSIVDLSGRLSQSQFGGLAVQSFAYDAKGRLASIAEGSGASGRTTSLAYGANGFLQSVTDAAGRTASFTHDPNGRTTDLTFSDGGLAHFTYDASGNTTGIAPPGRPVHAFAFNKNNQVSSYTAPIVGGLSSQTIAAYDADRQPLRVDQPDGQSRALEYDSAGRPTLVDMTVGDIRYSFDAAGRLTSANREQSPTLTYAYDGDFPTVTTWAGTVSGSVTRAYDNDFRVTSLSVNGANPVTLAYDRDHLPVQIGALTLTRSPGEGLLTGTALGNITEAMTYDPFGQIATHTVNQNGSQIHSTTYARDTLGRIASKTESIGGTAHTFAYIYDPAGRLTGVRRDNVLTTSYSYDSNGNRLSRTDAGSTLMAAYDARDRLEQVGTTAFIHNAAGERQSKTGGGETTVYQHDTAGILTGVTLPDATQIDYVLDGAGRRVGKKRNGTLDQGFLYQDGLKPIAELDGGNSIVSRFVYADAINVPAYMIRAGVTYRIITDHLGSPRLVLDAATGSVAQQLDYDAFGIVILDTNPGFQPFGFAGGLYDADTKLVRFGARDYDAEIGRWTTRDPLGFLGDDSNLYAYALNDPVNLIDAAGMATLPPISSPVWRPVLNALWGLGYSDAAAMRLAPMLAREAGGLSLLRSVGLRNLPALLANVARTLPSGLPAATGGRLVQGGFASPQALLLMASFAGGYLIGTWLNEAFCLSDKVSDAMMAVAELDASDTILFEELTQNRQFGPDVYFDFVEKRRGSLRGLR